MTIKKTSNVELKKDHFRVSIFCSARVNKGDPIYKQVYSLAKELGNRNIDVVTGGGPGLMEAANRGHRDRDNKNNSNSIGLAINLPKEQKINHSLDIVKIFDRFSNRLDNFMLLSNAVIIAPGGVGSTLEFFYTWQLVQTNKICSIPIIFLGDMWKGLIEWVEKYPLKRGYLERQDLKYIFVAKNYKQAIKIVDTFHKEFLERKEKGLKVCRNNIKYRLY